MKLVTCLIVSLACFSTTTFAADVLSAKIVCIASIVAPAGVKACGELTGLREDVCVATATARFVGGSGCDSLPDFRREACLGVYLFLSGENIGDCNSQSGIAKDFCIGAHVATEESTCETLSGVQNRICEGFAKANISAEACNKL